MKVAGGGAVRLRGCANVTATSVRSALQATRRSGCTSSAFDRKIEPRTIAGARGRSGTLARVRIRSQSSFGTHARRSPGRGRGIGRHAASTPDARTLGAAFPSLGCRLDRGRGANVSRGSMPSSDLAFDVSALVDSPYYDIALCLAVAAGAYVWVKMFNFFAERRMLEQKLSRKLIHITSGPLFMLTWPLFSTDPKAQLIAGLVPALQFARLLAIGKGWYKDENAIRAVSREGGAEELLGGPLYYVIVLYLMATTCWRTTPVGILAIALMCGGDGMADIVGRRLGTAKLPFNVKKSWAGSVGMFVSGSVMAGGFLSLFRACGFFSIDNSDAMMLILGTSLVATVVEALPVTDVIDDNIVVPASSVITSLAIMHFLAAN